MLPTNKQYSYLQSLLDSRWRHLAIAILFCFLVSAILYNLAQPVNAQVNEGISITVTSGMSTQAIGELLYQKGLIKNVTLFRIMARYQGLESSLQAGEYRFGQKMSVSEMIGMLARGETAYRQFTIPEGYTIDQIAALLESRKIASAAAFRAYAAQYAPYGYMSPDPQVKYKAEGFVFPDTYRVAAGIKVEDLVKMMVGQFDRQFTPEMRQKAADQGLSIREVVILASLVEREARVAAERPIIAGVFRNRLTMSMPLQSCATIQYILGTPKAELSIQDTELPSPYNTYQNMGLPPGPIASPGIASINAVLDAAATEYLYFVADKNGHHLFSRTYEEHLANIAKTEQ